VSEMTGFIAVISNMGLSVNHVYLNTGIPSLLVKIRTGSVQCFPRIDFKTKVFSYHK